MQNVLIDSVIQTSNAPVLFASAEVIQPDSTAKAILVAQDALITSKTSTIAFAGADIGVGGFNETTKSGWKTYNFEVADHHTYVADGVRVHNTSTTYTLNEDGTINELTGPNGEQIAVDGSWTPSQAYHYGKIVDVDNGDGTSTPTLSSGGFLDGLSAFGRSFADLVGLDGRLGLQGTFANADEGIAGPLHQEGLNRTGFAGGSNS